MKKVIIMLVFISTIFAGGIVHNTNHSADFIRTFNRNASTDVDAVYFNPAGLTKLDDGFYLYFSNQTIWQTRTVETEFPTYNNNTFKGDTFVPAFPNLYLAKKSGRMAFSAGFMVIGGGGSAEFPEGLPSFDYQLARLVGLPAAAIDASLSPYGTITGYSVTSGFVGSSAYFSGQANVSFALNDMISLGLGGRFIAAHNTYAGSLTDAVFYSSSGSDIAGVIPDMEVDSKRTGTAFTPVFSLFLTPTDMIDLSFRFEPLAKLEVTAETTEDGTVILDGVGMFPDGATYNEDMPAQIATGLNFHLSPQITLATSFNYYLNTAVNWDGDEAFVDNGFEIGAGVEYGLSDALDISVGWLMATSGATDQYQTDLSYSLNSNTIGGGFKYTLNPKMAISFGISNTFYGDGINDDAGTIFEERYKKTALDIAVGIQKQF